MEPPKIVPVCMPDKPANIAILTGLPWHFSEQMCTSYIQGWGFDPACVRVYADPTSGASLGIFFVELNSASISGNDRTVTRSPQSAHHLANPFPASGHSPSLSSAAQTRHPLLGDAHNAVVYGRPPHIPLSPYTNGTPDTQHPQNPLTRFSEVVKYIGPYPVSVVLYHLTNTHWDRSGRLPDLPAAYTVTYNKAVEGYGREGFAVRALKLGMPNTVTPEGDEALKRIRKRMRAEMSK
eukprot:Tbor_TRINITY_DN3219_c0_g1::TRINITY_DN3219_c0_g1_i1::g.23816::m.23816